MIYLILYEASKCSVNEVLCRKFQNLCHSEPQHDEHTLNPSALTLQNRHNFDWVSVFVIISSIPFQLNTVMFLSVTINVKKTKEDEYMQFLAFLIPCFSFICCTFCISMCYHWLQHSRCALHFFGGHIKGSEFRDFYLLNYVNYMPLIFLIKTRGSCVSSLASCEARVWIHSRWTVFSKLGERISSWLTIGWGKKPQLITHFSDTVRL